MSASAAAEAPEAKKVKAGIDRSSVTDVKDFTGARVLVRVDFNVPQDKATGASRRAHAHRRLLLFVVRRPPFDVFADLLRATLLTRLAGDDLCCMHACVVLLLLLLLLPA